MFPEDWTRSVVLVGLPGAGKSTVGRHLSKVLACDFVDTDEILERRLGCSIPQFFEREGEERFRDVESEVLEDALRRASAAVIATGGGIVKRACNRVIIHERALAVYLHATPRDLAARLRHDVRRPLLQGGNRLEKFEQLFAERHALYLELAQVTVDSVGRPLQAVLQDISDALGRTAQAVSRGRVTLPTTPSC